MRDKDMISSYATIDCKVMSSFLRSHNDKTENLLLPSSIDISNVLRNNSDDDIVRVCHEQDRSTQ